MFAYFLFLHVDISVQSIAQFSMKENYFKVMENGVVVECGTSNT